MDLKETKIPSNFIYPDIPEKAYRYGSGQLVATPLREDGDWRSFLPPEEDQNIRGVESSACYIEGSQHAVATIEEEAFNEKDNNYSSRFNALLSGGTKYGGDPLRGAESMRVDGLVPQNVMPFGEDIQSWEDFHSWKGVDEKSVRDLAKNYLVTKELGYDIVAERYDSLISKFDKLRASLKYSPCPVSVAAWFQGEDGQYYKPDGMSDNHLVLATYIDDQNRIHIWDTYAPYYKVLAPWYNIDFAMRWSVKKNKLTEPQKQTFLIKLYQQLVSALTKLRDTLIK